MPSPLGGRAFSARKVLTERKRKAAAETDSRDGTTKWWKGPYSNTEFYHESAFTCSDEVGLQGWILFIILLFLQERYMPGNYADKNIRLARTLRKSMTPEERHLWYDFLRTYPVKFYRQKCIDRYIVDFYCRQASLVIEIDGSQHYEEKGIADDARRTKILQSYHLSVMRFTNLDIRYHFLDVCTAIDQYVKQKVHNVTWSK